MYDESFCVRIIIYLVFKFLILAYTIFNYVSDATRRCTCIICFDSKYPIINVKNPVHDKLVFFGKYVEGKSLLLVVCLVSAVNCKNLYVVMWLNLPISRVLSRNGFRIALRGYGFRFDPTIQLCFEFDKQPPSI